MERAASASSRRSNFIRRVLATRAIANIEAGKLEIRPGLSNVLKAMSRIAPQFMLKQMAKMAKPNDPAATCDGTKGLRESAKVG